MLACRFFEPSTIHRRSTTLHNRFKKTKLRIRTFSPHFYCHPLKYGFASIFCGNVFDVCTTHTYDDKIAAIRAAQKAGLTVCSGGIIGLGETMEDRIDMVINLRDD